MYSFHRWSHLCCCCCSCCFCIWELVEAQRAKSIILASSTTPSMTWTSCSEMRFSKIRIHRFSDTPLETFCTSLILWPFLQQDSEQIKKLSPAEQKRKIVGILKKIDTDGDNLLSAGKQACKAASTTIRSKWCHTQSSLSRADRGAHVVDPACLQDVRSGRCQGKIPRVWHRPGWVHNMGGIQPGGPQSAD